jgi:hypothetical protein
VARGFKVSKIPPNSTSSTAPKVRARTQRPKIDRHQEPLWRSPMVWIGTLMLLGLLFIPVIWDWNTPKLLFYYLSDSSSSGTSNRKKLATICDAWSANLKPGDIFGEFQYADRSEPTRIQKIEINTDLHELCKVTARSSAIGHRNGTSPISPMNRLLNAVTAERARRNDRAIAAVMWLQEAEPIPGASPYDYNEFQRVVEQVVKSRAKIAIIGPTGKLGELLEQRFSSNPSVYLCPVSAAADCTQKLFDAARTSTK